MATIQELITLLPSADKMVKRAIEIVRKAKPPTYRSRSQSPRPLWSRVSELFGHGSGYSQAICVKYGFDPDETWIGESAR